MNPVIAAVLACVGLALAGILISSYSVQKFAESLNFDVDDDWLEEAMRLAEEHATHRTQQTRETLRAHLDSVVVDAYKGDE